MIFDAWEAWTTVDDHGRRGELIGVFSSEGAAELAAKGRGWYGGDGWTGSRTCIRAANEVYRLVDGDPVEMDADLPKLRKAAKAAALRKLTAAERHLLGLGDSDAP